MRKKKFNCLSKKFIIKGVATALVVLLPFSIIKPCEPKSIVGVDDALLLTGLTVLTVGGVGAYMGLKNSDLGSKFSISVSDSLSDFGNSAKEIYNGLAFGYDVNKMLPTLLDAYSEHLESIEGSYVENEPISNGNFVYYHYSSGVAFQGVATVDGSFGYNVSEQIDCNSYNHWSASCSFKRGDIVKFVLRYAHDTNYKPSYPECYMLCCFVNGTQVSYAYTYLDRVCSNFSLGIPSNLIFDDIILPTVFKPLPAITDTSSYPTSISISKDKVNEYVGQYVEEHPDDNDNKPDYETLIPFLFNLLEKDLGNGEITPQNLSSSGICSYVYPNGASQGYYPYYISNEPSNSTTTVEGSNININNNVNISNGSEISEEEKNGILNLLDNGVRKTTTLLNNLKNSMSNLGNTLQGLFNFLPEPVGYLFYSALCLSLIFFILSLRR